MKVQEPDFPASVHPAVRDYLSQLAQVINLGQIELPVESAQPTDAPTAQTQQRVIADPATGNLNLSIWSSQLGRWFTFAGTPV